MKKKTKMLTLLLVLVVGMMACKKDENPSEGKLPDFILNIIGLKSQMNEMSTTTFGHGPIGQKMAMKSMKAAGMLKCDSTGDGDYVDSLWGWGWETCAEITEYVDDEGYDVFIMDYGEEGCDEYGFLTKGKITTRTKWNESEWVSETVYDNFGDEFYKINGTASDRGTWTEGEDSMYFSGSYEGSEDLTIWFSDEEGNTEEFSMKGSYKEEYNANSMTILESTYTYESTTGESYYYEVETPLYYSFACEEVWVPVSGIEKFNTEDGEYVIDYGNGDCDNLGMITHDGKTYEYDFGDFGWWDGEGNDGGM